MKSLQDYEVFICQYFCGAIFFPFALLIRFCFCYTMYNANIHINQKPLKPDLLCLTVMVMSSADCRSSSSTTSNRNLYSPVTSLDAVATARSALLITIVDGPLLNKNPKVFLSFQGSHSNRIQRGNGLLCLPLSIPCVFPVRPQHP